MRAHFAPSCVALLLPLLGGCGLFTRSEYLAPPSTVPDAREPIPVLVRFDGAESIAAFRLRRTIEDRLLDLSRRPDSDAILQDATFDLVDRYRRDGFADVEIRARRELLQDAAGERRLRAVFRIEEGRRWTVRTMHLAGAEQLDEDIRRDAMMELWLRRAAGTFGFGDPLFVATDIAGFADGLALFLRSRGYLDAASSDPRFDFDDAEASVGVTIELQPGRRYHIGSADLGPRVSQALPQGARPEPPRPDAPATINAIESWRAAVLTALRDRGHVDATVRTQLRKQVDAARVDVTITAVPGPRARIDSIDINGLERTRPGVVHERLRFDTGDLYAGSEIDASLRSLYLSGLFRQVELHTEWLSPYEDASDDAELPVRLDVDIEEEDSRSLEFLAGWGSYERARGKIRFAEANLFGTGRGLIAETRVSTRDERGQLTVVDPYLFGTETTLSVSADAYRREEPSFVDRAWGGTVALQRRLASRTTARVGYTARLHTGTESDIATSGGPFGDEIVDRYTEGNVFAEARYDSRDGIVYPGSGFLLNAKVDTNQPEFGATIDFVRVRFGASWYASLTERLTLALRGDSGALWPEEGSPRVPVQERFYNGGENSVRSFRESQLGPRDAEGNPLGGEFRNLFTTELRAKLTRALEAAAFVDAGNVGSSVDDFTFADLRYGIGGGLRWALPIGPVRVDAAWNPDQRPGDREWTVHLSVGYPF